MAALLVAANPAQQNPKLIGQALSATPPALKLFCPKNSAALLEEEQRVVLENGAVVVHLNQTDIVSHGQLLGTVNCFLNIWIAARKISTDKKSEYLDHLHWLRHCAVTDIQFFHEGLISDLRGADSFDLVGRKLTIFVSHMMVLQTAALPGEKKSQQVPQSGWRCYQCGATDI